MAPARSTRPIHRSHALVDHDPAPHRAAHPAAGSQARAQPVWPQQAHWHDVIVAARLGGGLYRDAILPPGTGWEPAAGFV